MFEDLHMSEDENDVDEFGMDPHTRRRLRVKAKGVAKGKKRPMRPMRTRMPYSLSRIPKLGSVDESTLRRRMYVDDTAMGEARQFVTPGKEGRGKYDPVGIVIARMFNVSPEFARSEVERISRRNGWTITGAWPSSGRHILDWEFDVWGERGGDVIVKVNIVYASGKGDGISYRTNVATVGKLAPKFARWFQVQKMLAKREFEK